MRGRAEYPDDWNAIARQAKFRESDTCECCKRIAGDDEATQIGVHHLDGDRSNNEKWNLAVLCRRCHLAAHLHVQLDDMMPLLPPSPWILPHLAGLLVERSHERMNFDDAFALWIATYEETTHRPWPKWAPRTDTRVNRT